MLDKTQVEKAVSALLTLLRKTETSTKIVDQPEKIDLQLTLKVIPKVKHKIIKLDLPHSIHHDTREVCLFVKDLDKNEREYEKTVYHYQDLLRQKGITSISKIIPLKALRTEYSMHAAKRSLAKAYELYLADGTVFGTLPGVLGKIFFVKKKTWPIQINMRAEDLKKQIDSVVHNGRCIIDGKGSSCMAQVAHDRMSEEEIVSNILAAANQLAEKVHGGGANIRNLHIKCSATTSVPIYMDFGDPSKVEMPEYKQKLFQVAVDDVTTVEKGHVYVRADGIVKVMKRKAKREPDVKEERDADNDVAKSPKKKKKLDIKEEPIDYATDSVRDADKTSVVVNDDDQEKDEKTVETKKKKPNKDTSLQPKKSGKASKKRYFERKLNSGVNDNRVVIEDQDMGESAETVKSKEKKHKKELSSPNKKSEKSSKKTYLAKKLKSDKNKSKSH